MSIIETHDVAGMTCDHCARAVRTEVSAIDGVTDVDVDLDAHVSAGNIDAFGDEENGFDVDVTGITGTSGTQELGLDLEVGIGNLRVRFEP